MNLPLFEKSVETKIYSPGIKSVRLIFASSRVNGICLIISSLIGLRMVKSASEFIRLITRFRFVTINGGVAQKI